MCEAVCECVRDLGAAPAVCAREPAVPLPAASPSSAELLSAALTAAAAAPPHGGRNTPQERHGTTEGARTDTNTNTQISSVQNIMGNS